MEKTGLGERIREIREARGLSQVALARLLDLDPQSVRDYERERRSPTIKGLAPLAKALGVSVSHLLESDTAIPEPLMMPVSQAIKMTLCIPDKVYELAARIEIDNEAWSEVVVTLNQAIKDKAKHNKKTQKC